MQEGILTIVRLYNGASRNVNLCTSDRYVSNGNTYAEPRNQSLLRETVENNRRQKTMLFNAEQTAVTIPGDRYRTFVPCRANRSTDPSHDPRLIKQIERSAGDSATNYS